MAACVQRSAHDVFKLGFADEKGEVAGRDGLVGLKHVERGFANLQDGEVSELARRRQVQDIGVERGSRFWVRGMNDSVVQRHRHWPILVARLVCRERFQIIAFLSGPTSASSSFRPKPAVPDSTKPGHSENANSAYRL